MMLPSCTTEVDPNARELLLLISYRQLRLRLRLRIGTRMAKRKRIKIKNICKVSVHVRRCPESHPIDFIDCE
eukprot:scaffold7584_cov97-Skeletonema_dohrnii-CCMP3373.AAC.1